MGTEVQMLNAAQAREYHESLGAAHARRMEFIASTCIDAAVLASSPEESEHALQDALYALDYVTLRGLVECALVGADAMATRVEREAAQANWVALPGARVGMGSVEPFHSIVTTSAGDRVYVVYQKCKAGDGTWLLRAYDVAAHAMVGKSATIGKYRDRESFASLMADAKKTVLKSL